MPAAMSACVVLNNICHSKTRRVEKTADRAPALKKYGDAHFMKDVSEANQALRTLDVWRGKGRWLVKVAIGRVSAAFDTGGSEETLMTNYQSNYFCAWLLSCDVIRSARSTFQNDTHQMGNNKWGDHLVIVKDTKTTPPPHTPLSL